MAEPIFLAPVFQKKIWGGRELSKAFNYDLPAGNIGECWAISAHPHGPNTVASGEYQGLTLPQLWENHRDVFGDAKGDVFPLLTKILDAEASLSVQVHPDDVYAKKHEHELGKTECWYIISAEPGAYLIYGHAAKTKSELKQLIDDENWDKLFTKLLVKTGDFVYVPSGTIHALNKGIMALETQQSSDTTYRLYDYDRVDAATGKKRDLHIKQSIDVTTVPFVAPKLEITTEHFGKSTVTCYVQPPMSPFFTVWQWRIKEPLTFTRDNGLYTLVSVIDGSGTLEVDGEHYPIKKGQHFILPYAALEWTLNGDLKIIASEPAQQN